MKALTDKIIDALEIEHDKQVSKGDDYLAGFNFAIDIIIKLEKEATFEEVSRVVMKHLANPEKYHPHHRSIIDSTNAELLEGKESTGQVLDYIKD
jgi:hypothetical protein